MWQNMETTCPGGQKRTLQKVICASLLDKIYIMSTEVLRLKEIDITFLFKKKLKKDDIYSVLKGKP